jgi:hypothetical protein
MIIFTLTDKTLIKFGDFFLRFLAIIFLFFYIYFDWLFALSAYNFFFILWFQIDVYMLHLMLITTLLLVNFDVLVLQYFNRTTDSFRTAFMNIIKSIPFVELLLKRRISNLKILKAIDEDIVEAWMNLHHAQVAVLVASS